MPNSKSKLTCASLLVITSGCAIIESNRIEDMTPSYRLEFLQQKSTEELCNAYTHSWIKKETETTIRNILIERRQERCDSRGKVKIVYLKNFKPYETSHSNSLPDSKPVILNNINADQYEKLMEERHSSIMNGQKLSPIDNNLTANQDKKIKFAVVSEERWAEILPPTKKQTEENWSKLALSLAEKSQESLQKDDLYLSSELKLMSYIIANHVFKDKDKDHDARLTKIKTLLYETGLNDDIFSISNKNFLKVINKLHSEDNSNVLTKNTTLTDRKMKETNQEYNKENIKNEPEKPIEAPTQEINKQNSDIKSQVKLKKHSTDKKEVTKKITEDNSKKTEESSTKENIEPQKTQDIKENQQSLDKKEPIKIKSFFDL